MKPSFILALLAVAIALPSFAQVPAGDGDRASTPPGSSRDGAGPSDGAIKGGSIAPGESGGVPNDKSLTPSAERAMNRCNDLEGALREQCLRQERGPNAGGSTGGTSAPGPGAPPSPREAPPPQNPR